MDMVKEDRIMSRGKTSQRAPLNTAQLGVYLECLESPSSLKYNCPVRALLPEGTELPRFIFAVETVCEKHPALNAVIRTENGTPFLLQVPGKISVEEWTADSIDAAYRSFVRPFDLEHGPLCRFSIVRTPEGTYFLYDVHHLIYDGSSQYAFIRQLARVYEGGVCPEEELTLFEEAAAEQQPGDPERIRAYQTFFDRRFEGVDCDTRPLPDQLAEHPPKALGELHLDADAYFRQTDTLDFVRTHSITENALFLGSFGYALVKCCGTDCGVFNTAHHGRFDPRLAQTMGMFVRTLPVVCSFTERMTPADYLRGVCDDYYYIKKNDVIPFGELAARYGVRTDVSLVYQGELLGGAAMAGGILQPINSIVGEPVSDIQVLFLKTDGGYHLDVFFRSELYTDALIRSFVNLFLRVTRGMLHAETLGDIPLLDPESEALLERFNATEAAYQPELTTVDAFRAQAAKTPDRTCLVYRDKRYTYKEVDIITDKLAAELLRRGVGPEKVVGVLIPRCQDMLLCSLGVLKAGGAYLPLDPTYPAERLNLMMQDSGAMLLLADRELVDIIGNDFCGDRLLTERIPTLPDCDLTLPKPKPEDLFIVLYTSGSTGTPKGVMYRHSNSFVTTQWVKKYFDMDERSRVTAYASYGFDANTFDMYPAITSGAELHIISDDIRLDFRALRDYFNENGITHTVMTTQVGRQFAQMGGLKTLRHLSVAGEKLTPLAPPTGFAMYNLYGPSEGSVVTSAFRLDRNYQDVPIGAPVDNLKLYVVDGQGRRLPAGAVGELWIAGPHVTRGYLNRPEKTAEAYAEENPFCTAPDYQRLYRTGDIVRLLPDGNLQFVGRRDAQVKVRGFRVELTEIEAMIRRFPGVTDATVAAFDDPAGGKFIAAYVVGEQSISTEALAEFIRAEKPPYMVPAVIMQIDAIPLTQNQKVNKRALPVPERRFAEAVAPENELQQRILSITEEVLGCGGFGVTADLFEAGLSSIGAVRLTAALGEALELPVRIADLKAYPTVRSLEAFLRTVKPEQSYPLQPDYPLTETQKGIFVASMAQPDTTVYNIPVLLRLGNGVDLPRLAEAVRAAINAHPYMKTRLFTDADGNVRALRRDDAAAEVSLLRCDELPARETLLRPFRLPGGELYRACIYETGAGNYLYLDCHHIISDGSSEAILLRDIDRAYAGERLQPEGFSGYEAALAEAETRGGPEYENAKLYWAALLSGTDGTTLPQNAPECASGGAGFLRIRGGENAAAVKRFCEERGFTLNAFFNTAFALTLSRFTGRERVGYATIYSGRSDSRLSEAVTMLVKTMPVAAELRSGMNIPDAVKLMQTQLLGSMSNDACSFAELAASYGVNADLIFAYQGEDFAFDSLCGEPAELLAFPPEAAKAPIAINVYLAGDCFEYTVEYQKEHFNAALTGSLVDALRTAVDAFLTAEKPEDVSLLSAEGERLYAEMNANDAATEPEPVHRLVERCAAAMPEKLSVIAAGERLSFRELNEQANILAHGLIDLGAGREQIIGLVLDRSKEVIIAELGVLKSGAAFLPMLPTYPDERLDFCLRNAESPMVLTTEAIQAAKPELFAVEKPYRTVTVEQLLDGTRTENPETEILPEQLAYCIYTSGSTGTPKGVMIEHRSFSNFVQTDILPLDYFRDPGADGACLNTSSISFDMSLYEIWLPLSAGKTMCMATEEEIHNPLLLRELMLKNRVQMMTCTPSFLNNMLSMPCFDEALRGLRSVTVGAEAFPAALYDALRKAAPSLQIVNGYGPTETTVCCSVKELHSGSGITIGRPAANVKYYVTDALGHIQPPYALGELMICGPGVSRGYVKLPEKNAASFCTLRGLPAYHSGDMVRMTGAGEIDFGGRKDNQVKLRGFRVELDEIEKVMCSFPGVKQSKVLVRNNGGEDYLAGFFTAAEPVELSAMSAHLKSRLTYYMVPAALMQLPEMPLTPNGKIDKNAFPAVERNAGRSTGRRAAKKSLEQRLCEMFASVLGLEEVYADDHFFELGGTSLSASKVTMLLMSEKIEVKYGDIFDHPTPEALAEFIQGRDRAAAAPTAAAEPDHSRETLKWNMVRYAPEVQRAPLGNVLLTGAVGFLGIHILRELLELESGHIYCLVRKGRHESAEIRLKTMLIYYFSDGFADALKNRITVLDADISDASLRETLSDVPFDTAINCAACVKHFVDDDILTRINVRGVENLIEVCREKNARLIQISTVSVPGVHTPETYEKQVRMHENELFVIDDMDNKYGISKYQAELRMFDAIDAGLRGKVIRVGNLMGRHSDGEFQVNLETNLFLSGIRGFATLGKYPISHMTDPMKFSPVDCTARAVVLLAGVNDRFTAFNCDNRYGFDEMKIIDACNRSGIPILPAADETYYAEYREKLADDRVNSRLNGLAAYDIQDVHAVETDNLFTTNVLYRIGFSWPLMDDSYLDRAIQSILSLDYFEPEESEEE